MRERPPSIQLTRFRARYSPEVRSLARGSLAKMRSILPGWIKLVYDNYNALAIGFSPTDRPADAVFSLGLYPRWVSLFILKGAELQDPHGLLEVSGKWVRHIILTSAEDLDPAVIRKLTTETLERLAPRTAVKPRRRTVIRLVSAKQRLRRPSPGRTAGRRQVKRDA